MKKRNGSALIPFIIILLFMSVTTIINTPGTILNSVDDDLLIRRGVSIDRVLTSWYQTYGNVYPDSLNKEMLYNLGLQKTDIANFQYVVDSTKQLYRLTCTLSSGEVWKSPGSQY